jgi:ParB family chromosome partitioning protein
VAHFREIRQIPLEHCVLSKQQSRIRDVEKDLGDLVDNIRVHGQLEPIIAKPVAGEEETYEIIAGQRRWLAMQRLGKKTILCAILGDPVNAATARALSISENVVRRDLHANDLIDACTELYRKYGSIKTVAEELGLPYSKVRSYVKYDRLRPQLRDLVRAGTLDVKTALRVEDHCSEVQTTEPEIQQIAKSVGGMTTAQQKDYFKSLATSESAADSTTSPSELSGSFGDVHQVLVTLRREEYLWLRQWAKNNSMTQDIAAATIIRAFFRARLTRPAEARRHPRGDGIAELSAS